MTQQQRQRVREALDRLRDELLAERTADGHWLGELSSSALSTATAVSAMSALLIHGVDPSQDRDLIRDGVYRGIEHLRGCQNSDGGFGDTDRSHSNIATSYLVLAASALADRGCGQSLSAQQTSALERYIDETGGIDALRRRYGTDKTFVVPILTNLAIAELVSWDEVAALPFEAAVFPQSMYRLLQMPVVSYAIPALVAIGQARHFHGRRTWPPLRWIRAACVGPSLKVLRKMQPESGGYLEATPLTAFVVMSLAATSRGDHEVALGGLKFLIDSMRLDGSWPIDTNLATWVTSLAIHALACDPKDDGAWCSESLVRWHLDCQHHERHPFTGAEPGGWGWSDLSGAVPDSDDTPAAILAIEQMQRYVDSDLRDRCITAVDRGRDWLRRLQNRDGGWPTFCRGWGKLPFDRSSNDLTAHALRALPAEWSAEEESDQQPEDADSRLRRKAIRFLESHQEADGSWLPLWFGNQDRSDESNPVYGTSRVLVAGSLGLLGEESIHRGCEFLMNSQNSDGGWGGGPSVGAWLKSRTSSDSPVISSIEETALAVDALASVLISQRNLGVHSGVRTGHTDHPRLPPADGRSEADIAAGNDACTEAIIRGVDFLLGSVDEGRHNVPWPIGFYFAKLWYHERLYPLIFTTTAFGKYLRATTATVAPHRPR